jgi:hypothetical protein
MGGTTGSGVTASSVTSLLATGDRVTGPPGVVGDILLIDDGGDALLIDDTTSDNRLIED